MLIRLHRKDNIWKILLLVVRVAKRIKDGSTVNEYGYYLLGTILLRGITVTEFIPQKKICEVLT